MTRATPESLRRLAAANPVIVDDQSGRKAAAQDALASILGDESLAPDAVLRPRPAVRARRLVRVAFASIVALGAVIAAVIVAGTAGGPSLVSRAVAAMNIDRGVVHFLEIARTTSPAGRETKRTEVWLSDSRSHSLASYSMHLGPKDTIRFQIETAIDGRRVQTYTAATVLKSSADSGGCAARFVLAFDCATRESSDPFTVVRALYRDGRLHSAGQSTLGGRPVDVIAGTDPHHHPAVHVRVLVDPTTFVPLEVRETSSSTTQTILIRDYEHLPLSAATRRLLLLRPHPHAPVRQAPCGWSAATTAHGFENLRIEKCTTPGPTSQ